MTLKELCSQFTHDANLMIVDVTTYGKNITEIVREHKSLFQDIEVEDIDIIGSCIQVIISSGELASMIKAIESYNTIKDYCISKATLKECNKCIFRGKDTTILDDNFCILANNTPAFWDNI